MRDALPFKYFVQRAQILNLYRNLLRNAKRADHLLNNNQALQQEVIKEYRINQHLKDNAVVKSLLVDGMRKLELVRSMAEPESSSYITTHDRNDQDNDIYENDYVLRYKEKKMNEKDNSHSKGSSGSWIDEEDEDGPRGRVGVDWPWER